VVVGRAHQTPQAGGVALRRVRQSVVRSHQLGPEIAGRASPMDVYSRTRFEATHPLIKALDTESLVVAGVPVYSGGRRRDVPVTIWADVCKMHGQMTALAWRKDSPSGESGVSVRSLHGTPADYCPHRGSSSWFRGKSKRHWARMGGLTLLCGPLWLRFQNRWEIKPADSQAAMSASHLRDPSCRPGSSPRRASGL
jgi:hypothetical protein